MKTTFGALGKVVILAALQCLAASPACAQATRTWISGVGDDVNPCSRTAPCKTFAGAISKTAAAGEISVLDPGGYGGVTITKSITLNGDGTLAGVLVSGVNGIIVNAGANDVVIIRNLSIDGVGTGLNGIKFLAGAELHVENSSIQGFSGQGILLQPSALSRLFVNNTAIRNNAGGGLHFQPTSTGAVTAVLDKVTIAGNLRGIRAEDASYVTVSNSSVVGSDFNGIVAAATTRNVSVALENCVVSYNGSAGIWSGAIATIRMQNTLVSGNSIGLNSVDGGAIVSFGNNRVYGNTSFDGGPTSLSGFN